MITAQGPASRPSRAVALFPRIIGAAFAILIHTALVQSQVRPPDGPFELKDGDRVVFLGNTFIEREQQHGDIEMALTRRFHANDVTFRNLGWSGDDVFGSSRGRFGGQPEGYKHLTFHVNREKPTVIFVCYGQNEAHAGPQGLQTFTTGLGKLLQVLESTKARIVLVSPFRYEKMPAPLPDPSAYNSKLGPYVKAMADIARERGHRFVNLYNLLHTRDEAHPDRPHLTYNGIHLSSKGYAAAAHAMMLGLGLTSKDAPAPTEAARDSAQTQQLRLAIQKKNELYFHRYRPQNETYLFLFRKHEQGNNAVEIPMFDPLIAEQEKLIGQLRRPPASASK